MNTTDTMDETSKLLPYEAPRMVEFMDRADVQFVAGFSDEGDKSDGTGQDGEALYGDN